MTQALPASPATALPPLERRVAKHIIERLGTSGVPPIAGILHINAGNEKLLGLLEEEYFEDYLDFGSTFKLVEAHYGGGKTHFLHLVQELAWRHGFACALVELSPAECPYDDPVKVYRSVVRRLRLAPHDPLADESVGLVELLRRTLEDEARRVAVEQEGGGRSEGPGMHPHAPAAAGPPAFAAMPPRSARLVAVKRLVERVRAAPIESAAWRAAVIGYLQALGDEHAEGEATLRAWLEAEEVPASVVREYQVNDRISKANGFTMLRSVTQAVRALGHAGTALLFDEVDRTLSVSSRRTEAITDNLRQVIDLCGQRRLPSTLFLYAVPPDFRRNVVSDYPALAQRLEAPIPFGHRNPLSPCIALDALELAPDALLAVIAERVVRVYEVARRVRLDAGVQRENAARLAARCLAQEFDVNHRRLFVKVWVAALELQRAEGEGPLSAAALDELLGGGVVAESEAQGMEAFGDDDF